MTSELRPALPPREATREELVTSTGWRIVGREAQELVSRAAETALVPAGRDEDVLYAARFVVRPRLGGGSPIPAALVALSTAIGREWQDAPPLLRDRSLTRRPTRFSGLTWDVIDDGGVWAGELLWRHPHPVVAGAPCTTHVVLLEQNGHTTLTVRVTADSGVASVRGMAGAGQARPAFLTEMHRALRLIFHGGEAEPRPLSEPDIDRFVAEVLLSEQREHPVAVLAPLEEGGFVVPPAELAENLLGLAHLYVMERHATTFRLSDALGDRRLSCYWGALRVYLPEFSCADRPEDHPLLVRDRLIDPVMRADLLGRLGRRAGGGVTMPPGVEARRRPPIDVAPVVVTPVVVTPAPPLDDREPPPGGTPVETPRAIGTAAEPDVTTTGILTLIGRQLADLTRLTTQMVETTSALASEIERFRTANAVRTVTTVALERRIQELEQTLREHLVANAPTLELPTARSLPDEASRDDETEASVPLAEVLRQAATSHADALLVLESAERAAERSPYEDPERLAVILDAMAQVARRRQSGALGTSLREAFRELGIDYRGGISPSTSKRLRQQYQLPGPDGHVFECQEHIVLGNSYDPRRCLRIYFTSRAPVEPRFVIGHVGRHFDVKSTT